MKDNIDHKETDKFKLLDEMGTKLAARAVAPIMGKMFDNMADLTKSIAMRLLANGQMGATPEDHFLEAAFLAMKISKNNPGTKDKAELNAQADSAFELINNYKIKPKQP